MIQKCDGCLLDKPITNFRPRATYVSGGVAKNRSRSNICRSCDHLKAIAAGRCPYCKNMMIGGLCEHCKNRRAQRVQKLKSIVFSHYGALCAWCGESEELFLTIDHIHGDGKIVRNAGSLRRWTIAAANLSSDLRILCHNCNSGRAIYGDETIRTAIGDTIESMLGRPDLSRYQIRNIKYKSSVLSHYGNNCAICGQNRFVALTIDHIAGGGRMHRKFVGNSLARWLVNNNFPTGYRILCWNCNSACSTFGEKIVIDAVGR